MVGVAQVDHIAGGAPGVSAVIKTLRIHHWVKNLLLFLPFLMAHEITDPGAWITLLAAFGGFSLAASATYIANDLLDLSSDRRHPTKRQRPLAAGALRVPVGIVLALVLMLGGFAIAGFAVSGAFAAMLGLYVALSISYSLYFKRVPILDVLLLAGLYTHRVLAGGIASETTLSPWLLSFATFFFLSLAMLKRYIELRRFERHEAAPSDMGYGYWGGDVEIIRSIGPASGYLSVLVLGLYLHGDQVIVLYARPEVLWFLTPLLLYWITRIWLLAHRGRVDDDPIVFAVRDWPSYVVGVAAASVIVLAAL